VNEKKLQEAWRFGDGPALRGYQAEFEGLIKELYGLEECDLRAYFNDAQIQYVPFYSFGEEVAVRSEVEVESNLSLARSYINFADVLVGSQNPWDYKSPIHAEEVPSDSAWFEAQKDHALEGLSKTGRNAYMEVRLSLAQVRIEKSRSELLEAARGAHLAYADLQLGMVNLGESRPRPSVDGITAESSGHSYNYWTLRSDGGLFSLRALPEDRLERYVYFDVRIAEIAEVFFTAAHFTSGSVSRRERPYVFWSNIRDWRVGSWMSGGGQIVIGLPLWTGSLLLSGRRWRKSKAT